MKPRWVPLRRLVEHYGIEGDVCSANPPAKSRISQKKLERSSHKCQTLYVTTVDCRSLALNNHFVDGWRGPQTPPRRWDGGDWVDFSITRRNFCEGSRRRVPWHARSRIRSRVPRGTGCRESVPRVIRPYVARHAAAGSSSSRKARFRSLPRHRAKRRAVP